MYSNDIMNLHVKNKKNLKASLTNNKYIQIK